MKKLFAENVVKSAAMLAIMKEAIGGADRITDEDQVRWGAWLRVIRFDCESIGLDSAVDQTDRIEMHLTVMGGYKPERMLQEVNDLENRFHDGLHGSYCFILSREEAKHFNNPRESWEAIIARFPDTVSDVEEARKCLALSRYAASVFHGLQIVELGLIELGRFLKVQDPKSGWTAITNALAGVMKKGHDKRTPFERKHFVFLEQLQGTVEALKNAWRNKISHAQGKLVLLTADFTPEIAEEILLAARAFMRRLADGLPPPASRRRGGP